MKISEGGMYGLLVILYMFKVIPEIFTMAFFRICDFLDFEVLRSQILLEMQNLQEKTPKQLIFSHFFDCFYKNCEKFIQSQP